jgi:DNA-directed RNA polymerase subunit RPC12/RpoP
MITKASYQCSVCDNLLQIHPKTNYVHCTNCQNILYKNEEQKLEAKLIKPISNTSSPIQMGTTGVFNNESFTVIGRCKMIFENETISFFTIIFSDNNVGILAVNTGVYTIGKFVAINDDQLNTIKGIIKPKTSSFIYNDVNCICTNVQSSIGIEAEGNFYFTNVFNDVKYISFSYESNSRLVFLKGNQNIQNALLETFVTCNELQLQNLRTVSHTIVSCTVCKNSIKVSDIDNLIVANCNKCASNLLFKNNQLKQYDKNNTKSLKIYFNIGEVLEFYNHTYTIIGICIKEDFTIYKSKWREYCLYNPTEGYLFLNEFDGHWIIVNKLFSNADTSEEFEIIEFEKKQYELYNKYSYKTIYIEGCIPYYPWHNKQQTSLEYIAPPTMVIKEKFGSNVNWFAAKHVNRKDLQKQCKNSLPYKIGVGAIEDKGQVQSKTIFLVALLCLLFTITVHLVTTSTKINQNIVNENYNFPDSVTTVLYNINNVALDKNSSNLVIEVAAPVSNSWFELNIEVINNNTGERFYAEQGLEFYSGYDDGEYWKEGSTSEEVTISKIPKGNYTINLTALQEASSNKVQSFNVNINYDTPIFKNLMLVFLSTLLIAIIAYFRSYYINLKRWENSPYYELKFPSTNNE